MRWILRQALRTTALCLVLYLVAFAVSLAVFPLQEDVDAGRGLCTECALGTVYRTEPRYIVLDRAMLGEGRPAIVLLGASNVTIGVDRATLARELGPTVHDLGLGGANLGEVGEVADLVLAATPAEAVPRLTFVIGVWYGLFLPDAERWHGGPSDIEVEMLRYGLWHRAGGKLVPSVPPHLLPWASLALRPVLALEALVKGPLHRLRERLAGKAHAAIDPERHVVDATAQAAALGVWRRYMAGSEGAAGDAPYVELASLARRIAALGARVVIVDLPLPAWHRDGSPDEARHRARLARTVAGLADAPRIGFIDLSAAFPDASFADPVHPRPSARPAWAMALAAEMRRRDAPPSPADLDAALR